MTISTHVLDTSIGRPAVFIKVRLQRQEDAGWRDLSEGITDGNGRVGDLLPAHAAAGAGTYRLVFEVAAYFASRRVESFYSTVAIEFIVRDAESHYHVPLLLSPYGYSTYRGS
jgi:5-hydroxyisourate hydrolase